MFSCPRHKPPRLREGPDVLGDGVKGRVRLPPVGRGRSRVHGSNKVLQEVQERVQDVGVPVHVVRPVVRHGAVQVVKDKTPDIRREFLFPPLLAAPTCPGAP